MKRLLHQALPLASLLLASHGLIPNAIAQDADKASEETQPQAKPDADLLRFTDSNLRGIFLGFAPENQLRWKSPEAKDPITFSTLKMHRVLLNKGRGHRSIVQTSAVSLINGETIPCSIISVTDKEIVIEADYLGQVNIPRDAVRSISPSPFGGKIHYYGPLNTDGWEIIDTQLSPDAHLDDKAEKKDEEKKDQEAKKPKKKSEAEKEEDKKKPWKHYASAWYSGASRYSMLTRKDALPDQCRLMFKAEWQGSMSLSIMFHADFKRPKREEKAPKEVHGYHTGSCYKLTLSSSSASLSSYSFDEKGDIMTQRVSNSYISTSLSRSSQADIELRLDKENRIIMLFVNGYFKAKWDIGDDYISKGKGLAFISSSYNGSSKIRISDIIIAPWNGRQDSASSMTSKGKDVILLTNGLDRFSGEFLGLENGKATFKSKYGSKLLIPTDQISQISFAANHQRKLDENEPPTGAVKFSILPHGYITGTPSPGTDGRTKLLSPLLGELQVDLRYIDIIDFSKQNSLLDLWDENF